MSSLREWIQQGGVGPVFSDGQEIVRGIFVTARDRNWQEVPPSHWSSDVDERRGIATLKARHHSDLVDFAWQGSLTADPDARLLRFSFTGRALRDMEICRLGLVVLHPLATLIGSEVSTSGPAGGHKLVASAQLHPQPIVDGVPMAMTPPFSELSIERADFGALQMHFDGDLFELEDQRNWGDASFKSYCTPLHLGFPRQVKTGTVVAHSVEIRFEGSVQTNAACATRPASVPGRAPLAGNTAFPAIGRQYTDVETPAAKEALAWQHVQLDGGLLESAADRQKILDAAPAALELCMTLDAHRAFDPGLIEWLHEHASRIRRILAYGAGSSLPSGAALARLRKALGAHNAQPPPILAATRGYFVEFNRSVEFAGSADGIAFPLTGTVHSDDAATIMGNAAVIGDIARTARELTKLANLSLAPLALYHPRLQTGRFPPALIAPWLLAVLCEAARAQVCSVTLGTDIVESLDPGVLRAVLDAASRNQLASDLLGGLSGH